MDYALKMTSRNFSKEATLPKESAKLWTLLKHWMWFYWLTLSQHHPCVICERGSVSPAHARLMLTFQRTGPYANSLWQMEATQPVDWDDGPPRVFQQLWAEELYVADAHCSLSFRGSYRMVESSDDVWMLLSVKGMTGFSHHSFLIFPDEKILLSRVALWAFNCLKHSPMKNKENDQHRF